MSLLSSFNCCFKNKSKVAATTVTSGVGTQEKEPLGKEDYYDFLAPSVHHLQTSFLNAIEESGLDRTATLYDIEDLMSNEPGLIRKRGLTHTCPIDGEVGSSYVHSLELDSSGKDHVGTANYMLSYAWGYSYSDIVDTLVEFCRVNELDPKRTYIWICAFCNNQHRVVERDVPFDEFKYVFKRRVKGIGNILAMMTPWHDPGYLKRVWCIFEMYSANADDDTNIQIIMPPAQKNSLMNAVLKPTDATGKNGLDELFATLASTSVEKAQSSRIRDKENILRLVEDGPGCQSFNNEINRLLRKWVMDTVFEAANEKEASLQEQEGYSFDEETRNTTKRQAATFLTFCASYFSRVGAHKEALELHQKGLDIYKTLPMPEDSNDADSPKELMARCYNNMGTEHESLGNYEEALKMHHQCREAFEDIYGTDHENTSVSYFNIGAVLRKMEKTEEAVEMYTKSMDIDSRIKGEDHIDVGLSLSYIGRVMQANGDYEDALKNFEKSLKIRKDTYGDTHPDVSIGYGDMGLLHHVKGDYAKAIEYHEQALTIQEQLLGTSHPDTASIYQNLGGAYYEMGPEHYDTALELHKKAKSAYLTTFGEEHPKAKVSQEWIDIVENAIAENS